MEDLVIRPSTKIVMASYVIAALVTIGGIVAARLLFPDSPYWWLGAIPGFGYEMAIVVRHLGLLMEKLTISNERLRYESGFISKSTHTIDLGKVQDVRVDQNVKQRYENSKRGWRIVTSVGAGFTGDGGNRILIDDPHDMKKIFSDVDRKTFLGKHLKRVLLEYFVCCLHLSF